MKQGPRRKGAKGSKAEQADGTVPGADNRGTLPLYRPVTREYGLLIKDQDILDLIWGSTVSDIYLLAGRILAIQDALEIMDLATINAVAQQVAEESKDALFRHIVRAINQGMLEGETWCAGFTTRALLTEAFSKTPEFFRAQRAFLADLRITRRSRI